MTKGKLMKIIQERGVYWDSASLANRIMSDYESEREGEVVLGETVCIGRCGPITTFKHMDRDIYRAGPIKGTLGTLIFKPTSA